MSLAEPMEIDPIGSSFTPVKKSQRKLLVEKCIELQRTVETIIKTLPSVNINDDVLKDWRETDVKFVLYKMQYFQDLISKLKDPFSLRSSVVRSEEEERVRRKQYDLTMQLENLNSARMRLI